MGKKSPSVPAIPNPERVLEKEAELNRVNQYGPFGNVRFGVDDDGRHMVTRSLSPELQNLFGNAVALAGGGGQQFDAASLPQFSGDLSGPNELQRRISAGEFIPGQRGTDNEYTQAAFEQAQNLLNPVFEDRERTLTQRLANQGLPVGGEAYSRATGDFEEERNKAFERAAFQAIGAGDQRANQQISQEQSALAQALAGGNFQQSFGEQARQSDIANLFRGAGFQEGQRQFDTNADTQQRQQMFNMVASLLGLSPTPQIPGLNVQGAFNAAQQQANINANAENAANQNTLKNIASIVGMIPI